LFGHTYSFCLAVNLLIRLNKYDLHESEGRMQRSTAQPAFEVHVFGVDAAEYQDVYFKAVSGSDC
jgi:hypothetical protein